MIDPQTRYLESEKIALAATLEKLPEVLEGTDPKKAFLRTFDVGFCCGFQAAVVMFMQQFDITTVDTSQTLLEVE